MLANFAKRRVRRRRMHRLMKRSALGVPIGQAPALKLPGKGRVTPVLVPPRRGVTQAAKPRAKHGALPQVRMMATRTGEVRFEDPEAAGLALALDGQEYLGHQLKVKVDLTSQDGTKILVMGLPSQCGWQDLKDLMREFGDVAFVQVKDRFTPGAMVASADLKPVGQVRFEEAEDAWNAIERINGTYIGGQQVSVELDNALNGSGQRSTILVHGLQPSFRWQDLKDHFNRIGSVAYADIVNPRGGPGPGSSPVSTEFARPIAQELKAVGEVRFQDAESVQRAMEMFSDYEGHPLKLKADLTSQDGTKILIMGLPATCAWPQLKDFVAAAGPVAYAQVRPVGANLPTSSSTPRAAVVAGLHTAEVRFDHPDDALEALVRSNGSLIQGYQVSVELDPTSMDRSKLRVAGLPPGMQWQEVKDHFSQFGQVGFAQVSPSSGTARAAPVGLQKSAEVRFDNPDDALETLARCNGSFIHGYQVSVDLDPTSMDRSKLRVAGLPPGMQWQEVKDHFSQFGQVGFAQVS